MSIDCEICDSTIFVPDTIWYAGTLFSPRRVILCGGCASCIPIEERRTITAVQPFDLTFGLVNAEPNTTRQWYSAAGAINGPACFTVTGEIIHKYLPHAPFFLRQLFPYFCLDWFAEDVVRDYVDVDKRSAAGREKAVTFLVDYGCAVREWLMQKRGAETAVNTNLRKLERAEAEALLDELVRFFKKGEDGISLK